ncbi:branched-chain amino acid transport system permease protein [Geomicrobium halophilum]|uniref:Branched-chain amino acid transport system permease protein n=1 Tax=Geomicrobium halophilum TaxID=549000 RepID=A0A841PUR4_9BACL|nr:branched-chain amino acid ABC transporter permease [Geomicrobium halophilum]MBB6450876.1 branched-chain amino acid transport system permease protein [Geomicrobium halophilum]
MSMIKRNRIALIFLLVALMAPLFTDNQYYLYIVTLSFIWTIAVYGMNLIGGYTGQLSLAHAGFFAIGAYSLGLLTVDANVPYWFAFVLACLITTVVGFFVGLIALRTKEHFFAIYTLCVGYIIYLVIYQWDELTGGVRGLIGVPPPSPIGPISFESAESNYYLVLAFLVLVFVFMKFLTESLIGRTYVAIRNSEELAQTIGINTMRQKLVSFVISTFLAGLAGALYASFVRFLGPEISYTMTTFDMLTYLIVGGIGTLYGPLVGTFLIVTITQSLQFMEEYRMLIFGPLLVFLVIFYPRGIVGGIQMWKAKRQFKKRQKMKRTSSTSTHEGGD